MQILLTTPLKTEIKLKDPMPPLGLTYIAGVLLNQNQDVTILDNYLEGYNECEFSAYINKLKPDIIGITCNAEDRFPAFDLSRLIKKNNKNTVVVMGGPFPTVCHREIIEDIDTVDVVVRGEGEHTFLEIVSEFSKPEPDLSQILGITYRSKGQLKVSSPRPFINDLDELPFPAFKLLNTKKYPNYLANAARYFPNGQDKDASQINYTASLIFGRGCPFDCIFCSSKEMWQRSYRILSPAKAVEQIEYFVNQGVNGFAFWDDHLLLDKKWFNSFADLIEGKKLEFYFKCLARVDSIDEETAKRLRSLGCKSITLGIESGSEAVLKIIKKETDKKKIEHAVSLLTKHKITPTGGAIINFPGERLEDLIENFEFLCKLKKKYNKLLSFPVNVIIYPGTELEKIALRQGKLKDFKWTKPYYEKRNLLINARPYTPVYENVAIEKLVELIMLAAFKVKSVYLFISIYSIAKLKLEPKNVKPGYRQNFYIYTLFKVLIRFPFINLEFFSRTNE